MKKTTRYDARNIAILFLILTVFLIALTRFKYYFGSTTDWVNQHWILPNYFRTLFYDTHELFPSFAFNIGDGQNIYYFAYYGLFSPLILLSYFFPKISMMNYIMIISIASLYLNCILFYTWISTKFNRFISFASTFMFIFSMPVIFHSHRHIMFINYLPFLLLALISVDTYLKKHRRAPLIISCFLIIMTSFYFAVGAFITVMLYAIYAKLKSKNSKGLLLYISKISGYLAVSGIMSGILIIPTLYTILSGRCATNSSVCFENFIPKLDLSNILYSPYSPGLTSVSFIALMIGVFSRKKHTRFLSAAICVFSFFPCMIYFMNGKMYFDAKVLIPFIPIILLITADFCKSVIKNKLPFEKTAIIISGSSIIAIISTLLLNKSSFQISHHFRILICIGFLAELIIILASVLIYQRFRKQAIILIPVMLVQIVVCISCNFNDRLVRADKENYDMKTSGINKIINETLESDSSFYRTGNYISPHDTVNMVYNSEYYQSTVYSSTHNKYFRDFYFNSICNENRYRTSVLTAQPQNYLFNMFMGNKYVIDKSFRNHDGYKKIKDYNDLSLYENENVLPVGFASDKQMSRSEYDSLSYPYNIEALLKYIITDDCEKSDFQGTAEKITFPSSNTAKYDLSKAQNNTINIDLDNPYHYTVNLGDKIENKLIMLRFSANNPLSNNDIWISINGTINTLTKSDWKYHNNNYTFDYIFAIHDSIDKLDITFSEGIYSISDLNMYTMPINDIDALIQTVDEYIIDREKTYGDNICGTINVSNDSKFILSIPYDKGFTVMIDGKKCDYQCTNMNFIGFDISKGNHTVELMYKSPWRKTGIILSSIGLTILLLITFSDIFKSLKNK